jgi:hypothetical protein
MARREHELGEAVTVTLVGSSSVFECDSLLDLDDGGVGESSAVESFEGVVRFLDVSLLSEVPGRLGSELKAGEGDEHNGALKSDRNPPSYGSFDTAGGIARPEGGHQTSCGKDQLSTRTIWVSEVRCRRKGQQTHLERHHQTPHMRLRHLRNERRYHARENTHRVTIDKAEDDEAREVGRASHTSGADDRADGSELKERAATEVVADSRRGQAACEGTEDEECKDDTENRFIANNCRRVG